MTAFRIGSENGEHVTVHLPELENLTDDSFQSGVTIKVDGFEASISPYFQLPDLSEFCRQLSLLHKTLSGAASLLPIEGQFSMELSGNGRGNISAKGIALYHASYGSRLEYEFELDQTYLKEPLNILEKFLSKMK